MRARTGLALILALAPFLALAGCLTNPAPVGDADAGHTDKACPAGQYVAAFDAAGAPVCAALPSLAGMRCGPGEAVAGFDAAGKPVCVSVLELAEAAQPPTPTTPAQPAKSLSLTSAGTLSDGWKNYTIASGSSGMKWSDLTITVNGATRSQDLTFTTCSVLASNSVYGACHGGAPVTSAATAIQAGDTLALKGLNSGDTLRILDAQANAVMLTLTVG